MEDSEHLRFFREVAEQTPQILTTPNDIGAGFFRALGYMRLHITVTDADTGQEIGQLQTYRKRTSEAINKLQEDLEAVAKLPADLLDHLEVQFLENDGAVIKTTTAQKLVTKQILGGRKRQGGRSSKTAEEYERIYSKWLTSGMEETAFRKREGISKSKWYRILNYMKTKVP